jgi:RecA/RadA recombinase
VTRRVVELAGPAGAGKTTLADTLRQQDERMQAGLAGAAATLARARLAAPGRWWTAGELRSIAYLRAWLGPAASRESDETVLLDHGPAYRLAYLLDGPPMAKTARFQSWWTRTGISWGQLLDAVIWLDAPDDVLIRRIDKRDRGHRIRGVGRDDAAAFLARYRAAYGAVLDVLGGAGTRIIRVDTSTAPAAIGATVQARLDVLAGRPR